ncbi:MAG: CRISPR-associated endonuclease Cas3'', partial [Xanthomonadales bacterium]|nr:CRISPR-associated endonuclease Cas3'' [Xanthomonadales bacterium]
MTLLTEADLDRLAAFLASEASPAGAMNLAQLEGFLTAIVTGPSMVPPSAWLPWLWDAENGEDAPTFESMAQAQEVLGLVMGFMNRIAEAFVHDPAAFRPLFLRDARWAADDWCEGFLQATQTFDAEAWARLWAADAVQHPPGADHAGWVTPFIRLGDDEGRAVTQKLGDAQRWIDALVPTLAALHDIGKITLGFQATCPVWLAAQRFDELTRRQIPFSESDHAKVSQFFLQHDLRPRKAQGWGLAVGAHHGKPKG